ncbi:DNA ligase 1-like [Mytilus trossulus]|uniref:DNA ligase 1-like n=1 Tax=Mytilus trossulus TaxID=6551 RepID=UPI003004503F
MESGGIQLLYETGRGVFLIGYESIEVPPPKPASLKLQATPLRYESRELSQAAYRNSEVHEEPKTTNNITDRGAIKIAEPEHVYSYTTGSKVRCAEPMSKERRKPTERRVLDISETPMRQSQSTRHPLSKFEDKTRADNEEGTENMANLYGIREQNEIRLVMVGKTGSGKSATGNTIMTKVNHFVSKLSGGSVTNECKRGECSQAGRKIVVIDTPGLFDTKTPRDQISKEIINCVHMSSPGPHVFLLVVQIDRFTEEEIETFNRLFDLFGEEMGRFAIITFTKLDDIEKGNTTVESYIDEGPDTMKEFLKRCHGRYIAFDNNASAKNKTAKIQREKEKAYQEIKRMKEEMETIDKEHNAELYRTKKKKKEEKEKQANAIEEKERYQMKVLQSIQEQQIEMNRKYHETEQQKELQLSKAAEQHSKIMEAEIKRIVDGNNQKYNEMRITMDAKDRANEKLQDQMAQQNASMQQFMRESDQRNKELLKQQAENIRQMADEKRKAEETLKTHLEEQKKSMDDKTKTVLQDQMEKDRRQREEFQAATLKANDINQARMERQNALMQNKMREKEQDFLKQQENQKIAIEAKTQAVLQKQKERDEKQSKEFAELKRQNEDMREKLDKDDRCLIS